MSYGTTTSSVSTSATRSAGKNNGAKTKFIESVNINSTPIKALGGSKSIEVIGDSEAVFGLQVVRASDGKFYNFVTATFETNDARSDSKKYQLRDYNKKPGRTTVVFPAASGGDTYTVRVFAEPHFNTRFFARNNDIYASYDITQQANATISFLTSTLLNAAGAAIVSSKAITTSTGSLIDVKTSQKISIIENQMTVPTVAANHGAFLVSPVLVPGTRQLSNGIWNDNALYWQSGNYVAVGAGTNATSLILLSVAGLHVGMSISSVDGADQPLLRSITNINKSTKTVTLSGVETWADEDVILFRAYGPDLIRKAIGISLELKNGTCRLGQTSTRVHSNITSGTPTALRVKGSQGVAKGATVRGKFVDNSSSADVCSISSISSISGTADSTINITNGRFDADTSDIRANTILYIDGSSDKLFLSGDIIIKKYPAASQNIKIDLTKIFTIGEAS